MLNYTKDFDGSEVGVTKVTTPESTTELYLKLDDISLHWWEILYEVLFNNTYATVSELYEEQLSDNSYMGHEGIIIKSDGVYMSVNDLLNSTSISYLPASHTLVNYTYTQNDMLVASFASPYYYFLDQLVSNVNQYNMMQNVESYTHSIGQNGHIMTYELSAPYFSSTMFMDEGYDLLNLHYIFKDNRGQTPMNMVADQSDIDLMTYSLWWPDVDESREDLDDKTEELYQYARDWVVNNKKVMGRVPDEVFIKTLALQLAIKYNNIFGVPAANAVEIMSVDTRDILRLMVGEKDSVYKYYSYSFSRYCYEEGGTVACLLAALYSGVVYISGVAKSILMIIIFALLIINVLARKILFYKENKCIEGYLITCAALVACNYLYALSLKISISIADFGVGPIVSFGTGILTQILYILALTKIADIVIKDWKNDGFYEYKNHADIAAHRMSDFANGVMAIFGKGANRSSVTGDRNLNDMNQADEEFDAGIYLEH